MITDTIRQTRRWHEATCFSRARPVKLGTPVVGLLSPFVTGERAVTKGLVDARSRASGELPDAAGLLDADTGNAGLLRTLHHRGILRRPDTIHDVDRRDYTEDVTVEFPYRFQTAGRNPLP
jgi:hypothetical protein